MAARKEWSEWHLTPRGWERGSTRVEGRGNHWADEPEDRVLSFVYTETETPATGLKISGEETWRSKTVDNVDELLEQHGDCPQQL
jgi:hypothetical protein